MDRCKFIISNSIFQKNQRRIENAQRIWNKYRGPLSRDSKTIRRMIKKYGIPPERRPEVCLLFLLIFQAWMILSGAAQKMKENQGYYKKILDMNKDEWSSTTAYKVIDKVRKMIILIFHRI